MAYRAPSENKSYQCSGRSSSLSGFARLFRLKLHLPPGSDSIHPHEGSRQPKQQSGVALFMVISSMTVLALLATELVWVSQVNQRIAYDGLDQLQAHYLAKTGFKLSLLRLKAYQQVKSVTASLGSGASSMIPKRALDQIWAFPFFFPIPDTLPGLLPSERDAIKKFAAESGLEGKFSSTITSEGSKYNLNALLSQYAAPAPSPSPSASSSVTPSPSPSTSSSPSTEESPSPSPSQSPGSSSAFDAGAARQSLSDYITSIIETQFQSDPDFADEYRDFRMDDFMDNLIAWIDRSYEKRNSSVRETFPAKGAPLYSISELRLVWPIDDALYDLIAPNLTASATPGININTMNEATFRALVSGVTDEEVKAFFEYRDNPEADQAFKAIADFTKYLKENVSVFGSSDEKIKEFTQALAARRVQLVTDETSFKITVQAQVNQSTRTIEAWVTLLSGQSSNTTSRSRQSADSSSGIPPLSGPGLSSSTGNSSGIQVTFMRFL